MHTFQNPDEAWSILRVLVKPTTQSPPRVIRIVPPLQSTKRERIAGGEVLWKPVDKAAAMLLAKAPDINKPQHESKPIQDDPSTIKSVQSKAPPQPSSRDAQSSKLQPVAIGGRSVCRGKQKQRCTRQEVNPQSTMSDNSQKVPLTDNIRSSIMIADATEKARDLSRVESQIQEITAALKASMESLTEVYGQVNDFTRDAVIQSRASRMSAVSELTQFASALREVRKFFLGVEYETETRRLREFVDLCDRLKQLKDSGFLDSVADTMLRLDK